MHAYINTCIHTYSPQAKTSTIRSGRSGSPRSRRRSGTAGARASSPERAGSSTASAAVRNELSNLKAVRNQPSIQTAGAGGQLYRLRLLNTVTLQHGTRQARSLWRTECILIRSFSLQCCCRSHETQTSFNCHPYGRMAVGWP